MWARLTERFETSAAGRWFAGREPNEQRIIVALACVIGVLVLWGGVWKPVSDWRAVEDNRYRNAQADHDWLRANETRARSVAGGGDAGSGPRNVLQIITRSAEAQGILVNRVQPEGGTGAVSVAIQGQPFNELVRWLHQLEENNGVTVQRLAVDAEGRPGIVNAQIRLL